MFFSGRQHIFWSPWIISESVQIFQGWAWTFLFPARFFELVPDFAVAIYFKVRRDFSIPFWPFRVLAIISSEFSWLSGQILTDSDEAFRSLAWFFLNQAFFYVLRIASNFSGTPSVVLFPESAHIFLRAGSRILPEQIYFWRLRT